MGNKYTKHTEPCNECRLRGYLNYNVKKTEYMWDNPRLVNYRICSKGHKMVDYSTIEHLKKINNRLKTMRIEDVISRETIKQPNETHF
jgi:hypothetical protein